MNEASTTVDKHTPATKTTEDCYDCTQCYQPCYYYRCYNCCYYYYPLLPTTTYY